MPQTILGSFEGDWFEVGTPEQARLLSDPVALRHLEPFLGRTLGAGAAAREAGVSVERMLYRVRQFLGAGLLEEVGMERRAGRPVRLYRAPAGLRVPFHLTPFADLEAQIAQHGRPFDRLRARAGARRLAELELGTRLLYRDSSGEVHSEVLLPEGRTLAEVRGKHFGGDYMGVLWLDDDAARRVQAHLDALREELSGQGTEREGTRPYLVQTALLPLNPRDREELLGPPG
ncbi:hypothetical protein [Deinococcus aestuarii]|uniref:hypothetical protein n=1 Tax=Deinococcus aestuarii TaxID=2774531 RepID=UPI001C0B8526|nr:hypothetical protein [Deinococcus aestuarii]